MQRSIYVDSARQDFKAWLRRKESDWTCSLALVAVKGKGPDEWALENATITRTEPQAIQAADPPTGMGYGNRDTLIA
jgi:hypothetical protein